MDKDNEELKEYRLMGRPVIEFKDEYCEQLIEHMKKGFSFASFAGKVGVCLNTIKNWAKRHENFLAAKEIGWSGNLLFWEELGIDGTWSTTEREGNQSISKTLNARVWELNMKNRHAWKDKTELSVDKESNLINLAYNLADKK